MKTKIFTFFVAFLLSMTSINAGIVTVGATGTYPSIADAITGVGTITEPLIIELTTDYAQTSDIISAIAGADAINTVTIRPQGTLTIAGNGAFVWKMDGCKYVTIDGRVGGVGNIELTLRADTLATSKNSIALFFENDASNNTVKYLNLRSAVTLGTWRSGTTNPVDKGTIMFGNGIATGNSFNVIDNCDLGPIHPYTGAPSTAIYSKGNEIAPNTNLIISNNKIYDYYATDLNKASGVGIQVGSGVGVLLGANTTNCTIAGNSFYQTLQRTLFGNGNGAKTGAIIIFNSSGGGFIVKDNYIGGSEPLCGGSRYNNSIGNATGFNGIYISSSSSARSYVYGNIIRNLYILAHSPIAQAYKSAGISINGGNVWVGINENDLSASNIIGDSDASKVGPTDAAILFSGSTSNASFAGITFNSITGAIVKIANNKIAGICIATNATARTTSFIGIDIFNKSAATSSLTIDNNEIGNNALEVTPTSMSIQNYQGRNCFGIYANEAGDNASTLTITNNKINNMYKAVDGNNAANAQTYVIGVWINTNVLYPVTITGNTIHDLVFTAGRLNDTPINWSGGITFGAQEAGSVISNNTVFNISGINAGSTNISGIRLIATASTPTTSVFSNKIYNLSSNVTRKTGQYSSGCNGIMTVSTGALTPKFNIYNNMIRLGYDRSGNADVLATNYIGIRDSIASSSSDSIAVYYGNTICIVGSNVAASDSISSFGMCFAANSSATRYVKNNLMINSRSNIDGSGAPANRSKIIGSSNAAGIGHYALGTGGGSSVLTNFNSNNNDYVASGTGGVLGRFALGAEAIDLAAIQSYTGGDLQSIEHLSPQFVDITGATPDLHLDQTNYNYNEGLKYAAVLPTPFNVDFDGNPRHTTNPTIGANEYTGLVTALDKKLNSTLRISVNGNDITMHNTKAGNTISVYNLGGQNVKQLLSNEGTTSFNMQRGVYLIKVNNEVSKIVI